ncbi:MAG: DUF5067 domain-containing protein [Peptostreptococcaceae bacterium]|nr:DUF5067 domain-containing protein [Peptostreptococcaceae bacterium]
MKKLWMILVIMTLAISMSACGEKVNENAVKPPEEKQNLPEKQEPADKTDGAEKPQEAEKEEGKTGEANIGDVILIEGGKYTIKVNSARLEKDILGNPSVVVNYSFTNKSVAVAKAITSSYVEVFQDGEELANAIFKDNINGENSSKDVEPNQTMDNCEVGFNLNSEKDIEILVSSVADDAEGVKTTIKTAAPK